MRTSPILLVAGAAVASANRLIERIAAPTPAPTLAARQDDAECNAALETILPKLTDVPMPDPTLLGFIADQEWTTVSDPCQVPEVTGDPVLVAEWSSWMDDISSFYAARTDEISALMAACTAYEDVTNQFDYLPAGQCGGDAGPKGGSGGSGGGSDGSSDGGSGGSGSGEGNKDGNNAGNKDKDNGAATQGKAMLGAVVAIAGFVAVGLY